MRALRCVLPCCLAGLYAWGAFSGVEGASGGVARPSAMAWHSQNFLFFPFISEKLLTALGFAQIEFQDYNFNEISDCWFEMVSACSRSFAFSES